VPKAVSYRASFGKYEQISGLSSLQRIGAHRLRGIRMSQL
jgi:hypothetical protein